MNRISWNFQELFTTWCHTAPPILSFYLNDFRVSQSKTRTLPYKTWGNGGIILWALLTVFLVLHVFHFMEKCLWIIMTDVIFPNHYNISTHVYGSVLWSWSWFMLELKYVLHSLNIYVCWLWIYVCLSKISFLLNI